MSPFYTLAPLLSQRWLWSKPMGVNQLRGRVAVQGPETVPGVQGISEPVVGIDQEQIVAGTEYPAETGLPAQHS